ncbi:MAG: aminotransferase class V-fold PLP-dependent enzyme [Phycisphaerales bacterium JB059]
MRDTPTRTSMTLPAPEAPVALDAGLAPLLTPEEIRADAVWPIRAGLTMLTHGSYGICPEAVREAQRRLRDRVDADPVRFFKRDLELLADRARDRVSRLVNAPATNLALVPNATFAVATVLHSVDLQPGDEVLVTNHEYNATLNELGRLCARAGARIVTAEVPLEGVSPELVVERVIERLGERTRLVVVSHIASASALVFPVHEIVRRVRERGIDILVDGAHAPGQIPVDLGALRPTFYAASCHKWLCTPKGTGFFYAESERHPSIKPLALSCRVHETRADRAPFLCDFDYVGTNDYTGNLVLPEAIEHLAAQSPGGMNGLMRANHELVLEGARLVSERTGVALHTPSSMVGTMVALALPDDPAPGRPCRFEDPIWDALYERHHIQVPVWSLPGVARRLLRVSAHLYTTLADFERLADALAEELERERVLASKRSA